MSSLTWFSLIFSEIWFGKLSIVYIEKGNNSVIHCDWVMVFRALRFLLLSSINVSSFIKIPSIISESCSGEADLKK